MKKIKTYCYISVVPTHLIWVTSRYFYRFWYIRCVMLHRSKHIAMLTACLNNPSHQPYTVSDVQPLPSVGSTPHVTEKKKKISMRYTDVPIRNLNFSCMWLYVTRPSSPLYPYDSTFGNTRCIFFPNVSSSPRFPALPQCLFFLIHNRLVFSRPSGAFAPL